MLLRGFCRCFCSSCLHFRADRLPFRAGRWRFLRSNRSCRCFCCCFAIFMAEFIHIFCDFTSIFWIKIIISGRFLLLFRDFYG